MKDRLGQWLLRQRIRAVMPSIRGRLLDLGCGTNQLVGAYPGDGVGVDVHQWGGVDCVVDDSSDLPFDDGSFDTVTITRLSPYPWLTIPATRRSSAGLTPAYPPVACGA